jgi:SSS family solute:Na+ symporter
MKLTGIDISVFATYLLFVIAIGFVASRRVASTKRDYFLAGDKLPWWMVGGSIVAANVSSQHFIGVIGTAYSTGFVAMVIEWGAILLGFNALLWVFLPYYLRNGFYTMPEFLEKRFGSAARTAFAGLILITYVFVEISAVLYLGSVALHALIGIDERLCIIIMAIFTGAYTIAGGLTAVVWTEMLQLAVLLLGGVCLSFFTVRAVGGWSAVMDTSENWGLILPATSQSFPWTMYLGGVTCISVFYCAANQFIVQRTLAAKDEWHARMGVVFTDYLKFLMPLIIVVPGIMAPMLFHNMGIRLDKPDSTFPMLVKTLLPTGLVGLVMAGLIAAVMSHISGAVNSCTTIATLDFYIPYFRKDATEKQAVVFGKIVGAVIVILGIFWGMVLLSHSDKPIFLYLLDAYGYVTPGIATMFLLGIFWRRTTHAGALAAGAATIPLTVAMQTIVPHLPEAVSVYVSPFMNRTGIVFWLCMLIGVLVSLCTKPKPEEEIENLIWTKASLALPKEQKAKMKGLRNPALWWGIVTAAVLFMYVRYAFDRTPPAITVTAPAIAVAGKSVAFEIKSSEPLSSLDAEKIAVVGGCKATVYSKELGKRVIDLKGDGHFFTLNVIPNPGRKVTVTVPVGAAKDQSFNVNAAASTASVVARLASGGDSRNDKFFNVRYNQ